MRASRWNARSSRTRISIIWRNTSESSRQTAAEQESSNADAPNIVIHIFSKEPRDYFEDLKLCIEAKAFPEDAVDFLSIRGAEVEPEPEDVT